MLAFRPLHECGNLITAAVLVAIFSMAQLVSEGSEEETSETSTSSRAPSRVLKTWQRWRPGSYLLVFLVNATATACLFPRNFEFTHLYEFVPILEVSVCPLSDMMSFSGLTLASFGAGCVAAFLQKRARASTHAYWACGYATINWFQSLFGSLTLLVMGSERHQCDSCQYRFRCKYGLLPGDRMDKSVFHVAFVFCRVMLHLIGLFWMQMLLAKRLDMLEQTSHQKYCSHCFRRLIWLQSLGVMVFVLGFSSFALTILTQRSLEELGSTSLKKLGIQLFLTTVAAACLSWVCNMVASAVAIRSLIQSLLTLRRLLRLADSQVESAAARSPHSAWSCSGD